ncbi:MAG: CpsD/CapB family tyrosine-protein kinase [Candidatus Omnitrophota bacterium]
MQENKDKLSEALKRAQTEREQIYKKAASPLNGKYVAPSVPKKAEAARNGVDSRLVAYTDANSPVAEQYRSLMTYVLSMPNADLLKVIAITSSSPGEGKTITALNFAIVLSRNLGKKVLVIDGNFRKPTVDLYLNINAEKGFSEVLAGISEVSEVIKETSIPNLFCIASGQIEINPVELLGSPKVANVLSKIKNRFDYIIIDTPAVIPYADARLISKISDGVILTIKAEKTSREVINRSEFLLKEAGAKLLGAVLTNIQYHIPEYIHKYL